MDVNMGSITSFGRVEELCVGIEDSPQGEFSLILEVKFCRQVIVDGIGIKTQHERMSIVGNTTDGSTGSQRIIRCANADVCIAIGVVVVGEMGQARHHVQTLLGIVHAACQVEWGMQGKRQVEERLQPLAIVDLSIDGEIVAATNGLAADAWKCR